jgi:hypothetical protein
VKECLQGLPSDHGDLAGETELLQSWGKGLVDARLQWDGLDFDILNSRDNGLALVNLDIVLNTLALLIVDHVDRVLLAGLVLADGSGLECAERSDGGRSAEAHASASRSLEGGASKERHGSGCVCVRLCGRFGLRKCILLRVQESVSRRR